MNNKKQPLIFYGWIVIGLAFLSMLVAYSLRYNFSVFYGAILEYFGWGRGATAAALSINLVVYALSCPLVGNLTDRFGIRRVVPIGAILLGLALAACSQIAAIWQLYLLIAVTAFGSCAIGFIPHVPVIANWFPKRRGLALGILNAGVTASALLAPAMQYLILILGWQGAFLVLAGISVIVAPLAAAFQRQRPEDKGLVVDGTGEESAASQEINLDELVMDKEWASRDWTPARGVKAYRFWWLILMCLFLGLCCYTFLVHHVAYLTDVGYTSTFAAGIVAIFGISATTGGVCTFISDRVGREVTFTIGSMSVLIGIVVLMLTQNTLHSWMPYLYATMFGFGYGICTGLMAVISAELFQGKHFGVINGIVMSCFVVGGAIGPWFAGHIFDVTGSYAQAFPLMYFSICASTVFVWLASPRKVRSVPGKVKSAAKSK